MNEATVKIERRMKFIISFPDEIFIEFLSEARRMPPEKKLIFSLHKGSFCFFPICPQIPPAYFYEEVYADAQQ
jgi:hypothetical protein